MSSKWDKWSRMGLDVASTTTMLGFSAAKAGTKLGFSITRGVASTAVGLTGTVVDRALFGGSIGAGEILGGAVSTAISAIESLALAPILFGESLTSTSLIAAHSTLSSLTTIFPGSDEASFSLASFVQLVRREWSEPADRDGLPEERYGVVKIAKALMGWATLQGVTSEYQERRWFQVLREIPVHDEVQTRRNSVDTPERPRERKISEVRVMSDVVYPSHGGQIVTADIGEAPTSTPSNSPLAGSRTYSADLSNTHQMKATKQTLRRLSKLVLGGYGGPSLLFFGVSPWPESGLGSGVTEKKQEELKLEHAVNASEEEVKDRHHKVTVDETQSVPGKPSYSWWSVLLGRHDHEIFMNYAKSHPHTPDDSSQGASASGGSESLPSVRPPTAFVGSENMMPRFWVLTDHVRREVVLVIRGTMSLNEVAVDLTCEPTPFELHSFPPSPTRAKRTGKGRMADLAEEDADVWSEFDEELESIPGSFPIDISTPPPKTKPRQEFPSSSLGDETHKPRERKDSETTTYLVHGGILKMARAMGAPGKPVHVAVRDALKRNRGYSLVLCGHSLGAGVAALLALMWANPYTRLTHQYSGLPRRRMVSAYCLAPPCLTTPALGKIAADSGLIVSFVYSTDIISRLSLGSVRDLTRCAAWLCKAEDEHGEGYSKVTKRALRWKAGYGKEGYEEWFLAMRKTLEANMHMTQLFPPGRVLWAMRDGDLHPAHRLRDAEGQPTKGGDKVRLFEVLDVPRAFDQVVFAGDMLSSHMPHQYDRALHELL
ncbi:alpha/beta-hydrolase [Fomitopsis serialis]|uniref:alpha/beta-hydrolase n=1 Tax=Fomitopsis serialis TaxID=139415 RepID=UPI0020075EEA|nr:alpha/beta-hydrolase [Neoantrodia serialis]KAH9928962.1 alpha/beta-hydrolase [Neoantrodia serialis]